MGKVSRDDYKEGYDQGFERGRQAALQALSDCYDRSDGRMVFVGTPMVVGCTCRCSTDTAVEHDVIDLKTWEGQVRVAKGRCVKCGAERWINFL